MEPWLNPLYDADGMRAIDGWAIEQRGLPSLELMEAAGREVATAVGDLAPEGPIRVVCGKGNNAGDGLVAARYLAEAGHEVEALLLWPAGELSDDAAANLERFQAAPLEGDPTTRLAESGAVVDAIFGTGFSGAPASLPPPRSRRSTAAGRPWSPATSPRASTPPAARSRARRSRRRSPSASTPPSSATASRRGSGTPASCAWSRSGSRTGLRRLPAAGEIAAAVLGLAPRRGPHSTKFSSGQVTIAGGSRGLTGAVQMSSRAAIRAGAGYATVAVPADLEAIFEAGQPEVMSAGCPGGDGFLAPGSAKAAPARVRAGRRRRPRARAGARPGLGRAGTGSHRRDRGAAGHRRRRAQRVRRHARADRRPRRADDPDPACGRAGTAAGDRLRRDRRPPRRVGPQGRRGGRRRRRPQGRRHDRQPTAIASRSTSSRHRRWRPPAPATSSPGSSPPCSPAGSSLSRRPARQSSPMPAPATTPPSGSGPSSR